MGKRTGVVRSIWWCRAMAMFGVLLLLWAPVSQGQTTSITSSGLNTHVSHAAGQPNYDIIGGTRPGNGTNLFHSFGDFSVGTNHIANFRNDSGLATSNILGRVTGGNPSNIFGTIQTTGFGNANLFLMNPAGMVFGPNASLNVGGSVTFTTADYLKLTDGARFHAMPNVSADGLLSAAPVAAFGFLGSNPAAIMVQGGQLAVAEGKSLSLVGGDIKITSGTLTASGGQINLVSFVGRGESLVAPVGLTSAWKTRRGHIEIKGGTQPEDIARLDTSGAEGGAVVIRGGKLSLTRAEVITDAQAANQRGGAIVIEATKSAIFDNVTLRTGPVPLSDSHTIEGGPVLLNAPTVRALNLAIDTSGDNAPGGNVSIRAADYVALQNSRISTGPVDGDGDSGNISMQVDKLTLTESTIISETAGYHSRVGNIVIDVGRLTMRGGGISTGGIEPRVESGDIRVSARDAIVIDRGGISTGNWGGTKGGSITVSTPHLTLNHSADINTGTLEAPAGDISVNVRTLTMVNGGRIRSQASGDGPPGNINIVASHSISIAGVGVDSRGREVPSGVSTFVAGNRAGSIYLVTPTMRLTDRAVVSVVAARPGLARLLLDVGRLDILRGARISSFGMEGVVPIEINAAKSITLDHGTITSAMDDNALAGNVLLHAGNSILIQNGSRISAENTWPYAGDLSNAGHIAIQAGKSVVIRDSTIFAQAEQGNGGTIDVNAKQVTLMNSQLTTSVSGGPQTVGGDIFVDAKTIALRNSQLLSTATEGQGGSIHLRSHALRRDARSVIDASSESGTDGTVAIESRR